MNGLELSRSYFEEYGRPLLRQQYPYFEEHIAAGLAGMGSECFGFDDEISRDHDWGPAFCLWLDRRTFDAIGKELQASLAGLPRTFAGFTGRQESHWGGGRTGVFEIGQFYRQFIGYDHVPADWREWRVIPESNLATATNGRVFIDPVGEFSAFREKLKQYYPEDIRLKKMACRCMIMAQSGQYNFMRCVRRGEYVAAQCAETEFINTAVSLVFLLNKQYKPFYKWMHRALRELPRLGEVIYALCSDLATAHTAASGQRIYELKSDRIATICRHIVGELKRQKLTDSDSDFLLDHGPLIQSRIQDPVIKSISVWTE